MKNSIDRPPHSDGAEQRQDRLHESELLFRSTFENAAVGIAHVAPDGSWLRVNRRLAEIVGYLPEELEGLTFQDITHPDDLGLDLGYLQETIDGKRDTYAIDKRYVRKDGSFVWTHLTVGCVRSGDGGVDYFISVLQDITEQERIARALGESEARYRNTFENAAVGIAHVAPDGTWLRVNRKVCELFGYSREELRQMTVKQVTHAEDMKLGYEQLQEIFTGKRDSMQIDKRYVRRDGETVAASVTISCVRSEAGTIDYMIAVMEDITETRRMHRALTESERRLDAVQQTSPDGFVMFSSVRDESGAVRDFECYYSNPAADRMVGRNGSLIGHNMYRDTPEDERVGLIDVFRGVVETGNPAQGEIFLPMQARSLWIRYSAVKVDDGLAVSFADITSRKQAEFDLRDSEARFRAVQQTTPDGFYICHSIRDSRGEIVDFQIDYINPAVERQIRLERGEVVGASLRRRFPANVAIGAFDRYVEVVETGETWQGEVPFPTLSGELWLRVTAAKVGDGVAVSYADITETKRTQALLQERDQRLQSIVNNVVAFVGLLSPEGVVLAANDVSLKAAGLGREDLLGKYFWETYWWSHSPEEQERLRDAIRRAARGEVVRYDATHRTVGDGRIDVDFQLAPIFDETGHVTEIIPSSVDITERKRAEEHREMLVRELSHRVKNSLATVQTIASHTLREASDLNSFREAFVGRLMAISKCHDLLVDTTRRNADLSQLVREQVLPYAQGGKLSNVSMSGPPLVLGAEASHTFGLVLHELATNAAKYGALSVPEGRLDISWMAGDGAGSPDAIVTWEETGGPYVQPPERRGFGSVLIEQSLAHSLGGEANIQYRPTGLWARFRFQRRDLQ